ncbi:MAG: hypothetical protein JWM55_673 [Acidimicrobiaceae bacterium]|nr:hypothetical protein [Acidimicrobiaceae bacterium]
MKGNAGHEIRAEFVAEPEQVLRIIQRWRHPRLELKSNNPRGANLDDEINLMATGFRARMMKNWSRVRPPSSIS